MVTLQLTSVSLEKTMSLFDGICLRHIAVLLGLLQTSTLTRRALIERRFQDHALEFEATLQIPLKSATHSEGSTATVTTAATAVSERGQGGVRRGAFLRFRWNAATRVREKGILPDRIPLGA